MNNHLTIKKTPQNAIKYSLLIENTLKNRNTDKLTKESLIEAIMFLYDNPYAHLYKNENLYQKSLHKMCQHEFIIESLIKHIANYSNVEQLQEVLQVMPKKFHDVEHALIAVSSNHIEWLSEFEKVGYDLHVARGSIVIPIWCQLLKNPDEFEKVIKQYHFRPKNWIKNLVESAVSFGNVASLEYLFEKNMYEPNMVNHYLNLYQRHNNDEMVNAVERLNSLYEKNKLELVVQSQLNQPSKMKL